MHNIHRRKTFQWFATCHSYQYDDDLINIRENSNVWDDNNLLGLFARHCWQHYNQ